MRLSEADYRRLTGGSAGACVLKQSAYTPTETAFIKLLDKRKAEGSILDWAWRPFRFQMDATAYYPSFAVLEPDGLVFVELRQQRHELEDDPEILMRAAAQRWTKYDFVVMRRAGKLWEAVWYAS